MTEPTILIVPGLRDHVPAHWQTLLAARLDRVRAVPPMGRADLDCRTKVEAIEREARAIDGPVIIVAHSGGAARSAPPDFERPMPEGPTIAELRAGGWLPVPRAALPFPSIVAASRNDPLGRFERVAELAACWGGQLVDLGEVGHLNSASGYGEWPDAEVFIRELAKGERGEISRAVAALGVEK